MPILRHKNAIYLSLAILFSALLSACSTVEQQPETQPQEDYTRTPVSFNDIPGWRHDTLTEAWPAFMQSCQALSRQTQWKTVCEKATTIAPTDNIMIQEFFELNFTPYKITGSDGNTNGLATGYYEPLLTGSRKRQGPYKTPLYRQPNDLLEVQLASLYPQLKGVQMRGKKVGQKVVPYETRGEIAKSNKLAGLEIVWVDDVVDAFFLEVQGSGRVYLPKTNETIRVAYANKNGHPYRSIGKRLVDLGELKPGGASAGKIKQWMKKHPNRQREILDFNPSMVFFREEKLVDDKIGPKGALGVPLTTQRSVAVDPKFIPLGAPIFIKTTEPLSSTPLQKLMMAQDTGGAIRGPVRVDYFWGFGNDAGKQAGKMKQPLNVWLLLPNSD